MPKTDTTCEVCGKEFANGRALITHMTWHNKPAGIRRPRGVQATTEAKMLAHAKRIAELLPVGMSLTITGERKYRRVSNGV